MSEYTTVECEYTDGDSLRGALKELGYDSEEHAIPQSLVGFQGDQRDQKAHIIVRRKNINSASNDIGFVKQDGKYAMIISEFDRRTPHANTFMKKLKAVYNKHNVLKGEIHRKMKSKGFVVASQKTDQNGRIEIRLTRR